VSLVHENHNTANTRLAQHPHVDAIPTVGEHMVFLVAHTHAAEHSGNFLLWLERLRQHVF
jgi:hypothetical protein